jgi:CarD family transcriptional regulator
MTAARKVASPAGSTKPGTAKAAPTRAAAAKKPTAAKAAAVSHATTSKTAKPAPAPNAAAQPVAKAAPQKAAPPPAAMKPVAKPATTKAVATAQVTKTAAAPPPVLKAAEAAPKPSPVTAAPVPAAAVAAPVPPAPPPAAAAAPAPAPRPTQAPPPAPVAPERRMGPMDRIPPRQPSKAEIFIEGDHVVYPTHGVGKVERIATEEIAGHKLELIHITFEENRMTLRVPVAKARSAGLRKLASRKLFDEAMGVLKGRARIKRTMWSRRAQEYEAKINSGDPLAIAEVVRDLHRNAGQPDQSFSERQIYEAAMDRLAAELAALDKTDKTTAVTKLLDFLKTVA